MPHTATVTSITGVNGETGATVGTVTLNTTHTNAGTYASDSWSFSGANYNNIASTTITDIINKATPTVGVSDAGGTYDGNPFPASTTAVGIDGVTAVSGSFNLTYYVGTGTSGTNLGSAAPIGAGVYTVVAAFTSTDPNYSNGSAQTNVSVTQACADGERQRCRGRPRRQSLPRNRHGPGHRRHDARGRQLQLRLLRRRSASGTPSATAPADAGTYTVLATFTSNDADYASGGTAQTTFTITSDSSSIVVNNPTDTPIAGQTDLREAITRANATAGAETITFDPTVFATPQTILLTGGQLELTDTTGTETITGPAAGVTISGNNTSRVFASRHRRVRRAVGADDHRRQHRHGKAAAWTTAARSR